MPERAGKARASLAVACVVLAATGVLLAPTAACTPHNCDPSSSTIVGTVENVTALDGGVLVFQSTLVDSAWIPFPGAQTITVKYPPGFVDAYIWSVLVSTGPYQDDAGATAATAAGSLDEILNPSASGFQLKNSSCTDYYVYFAVLGTAGKMQDGGPTGDASHD